MANNYSANTSTLTTDLSVAPYHDDYSSDKQFYGVLFRPSFAVQGRELNQVQTMFRKQIDRLGKHIFQEGSIVLPGNFTIYSEVGRNSVPYVKVKDYDNTNTAINIENYLGQKVRGLTNHVEGTITDVLDGSEAEANTKTLYVQYDTASNVNTSIKTFQAGETLLCNVGSLVVMNTAPTGMASKFRIGEGVFFAKEHFISFPTQSVILSRYDANPTCKVGFFITEEIVTADEDLSLLDPAAGSSNYQAPGADRLKLIPELQVLNFEDNVGPPDFVTLFTIKNGVIDKINERSQYNIIQDELAKRTYDESGDYYVKGLNVQLREHLNDGENFGRYTQAEGGNAALLFVGVDPGTAYVGGYEINLLDTRELATPKANTYDFVNSQIAASVMGSWVRVNEFTGSWELDKGNVINLYDTAQDRISGKKWSSGSQTGAKIGEAKLVAVEYVDGTPGYDAQYDIYLADLKMLGSNNFADVRSIYNDNSPHPDLGADIVLNGANNAVMRDVDQPLLFYTGSDYTRKIRDVNDEADSDTTFYFFRTDGVSSPVSIANTGLFTVALSAGIEVFPYGTVGDISSVAKKSDIQVSLNTSVNVALPGTIVATAGTKEIRGTGTSFTRLNVGDKYEISGKSNTLFIASIANNNVMNVTEDLPAGINGNTAYKAYKVGDILDLSGVGAAAGAERTVSATPTLLSFDLKETFPSSPSIGATVSFKVARTSAKEVLKTLKPNRVVKIDCSTAGTSGPFSLGFSDVFQVRSVTLKTGGAPASVTDGSDVTDNFTLNNGQRDTHYDLASITPKGLSLGGTDHLLIVLDYFEPDYTSRFGYFSVDSYPIDDTAVSNTTIKTAELPIYKSPNGGREYNLRNFMDFRPVKLPTATDTIVVGSASVNPANTSLFNVPATGLRLPAPSEQITFDYSYYLGRKDIVVLDNKGNFRIIQGVPGVIPITPTAPGDSMTIAVLNVTPYPSLSPTYARSIGKKNQASSVKKVAAVRSTMKDINVMKDRISNLEYYVSLSLLEKNALDFKILDENGLDRFKNGIFVDTFTDHSLGATYNPDYRIVIDENEKSIRPIFTMESFGYNLTSNNNVRQTGSILTMDYTNEVFLRQNNVTSTRNVERSSYKYAGYMTIFPDQDVWVDTQFAPDEQIDLGAINVPTPDFLPDYEQSLGITWESWKRFVVGYNIYRGSGSTRELVGQASTYAAALTQANRFTDSGDATIETLYNNTRDGTEEFQLTGTDTNSTGNKVIDVSLIPYIRPQTLQVFGRGLKPYTKLYVFFDGENVTDFVTPLTEAQFVALTDGVDSTQPAGPFAAEGSDLIADEMGLAYFNLRLADEKKFRVGDKVVTIIDNPTNDKSLSTTMALATFKANGLAVTKQKTVLSTHPISYVQRGVSQSFASAENELIPQIIIPPVVWIDTGGGGDGGGGGECSGYSFVVRAPHTETGIFLTGFDVFIAAKSPDMDMWFEIAEMDDGGITRNRIPRSEVWVENADIPISPDGKQNPLRINFAEPLFLEREREYAVIIHTENISPDFYLWVSRLGDIDVNTGDSITARPFRGNFYTTNNNVDWDIVPDIDLVFNLYRASFTQGEGTAVIGSKPIEKFRMASVSKPLAGRVGDTFVTGDRLTLSGANGSIIVGDKILGANSAAAGNSAVLAIESGKYNMANTGYISGEAVNVYFANGTYKGVSATISAVDNSRGRLRKVNETSNTYTVHIDQSTGGFSVNTRIISLQDNTFSGIIQSIEDYRYSVVDFEPSAIEPFKTEIGYEMKTYNTEDGASAFIPINAEEVNHLYGEKLIKSRTNEVADISGNASNQVRVKMRTNSEWVSPVFNLERSHTIFIDNLINANTSGEDAASGGALYNKYISKTVTLAEGQDAEDIIVRLTSYRPPQTDVKVWVKLLHGEDSDVFGDRGWLECEKAGEGEVAYSSLSNRNDFREFKYLIPGASVVDGVVQYTNSKGITFSGYKYFAVKIGLLADDSSIVPRVADLQVIACQV